MVTKWRKQRFNFRKWWGFTAPGLPSLMIDCLEFGGRDRTAGPINTWSLSGDTYQYLLILTMAMSTHRNVYRCNVKRKCDSILKSGVTIQASYSFDWKTSWHDNFLRHFIHWPVIWIQSIVKKSPRKTISFQFFLIHLSICAASFSVGIITIYSNKRCIRYRVKQLQAFRQVQGVRARTRHFTL